MSFRATVLLLISGLFALFAFTSTAVADGSGENSYPGPWITSQVIFDGDFAYWTQIEQPAGVTKSNNSGGESKPPRKVQAIIQQQLSTGASRRMFATTSKRVELKELTANAGRLAFVAKSWIEARESKPVAVDKFTVYAMGAADAAPVALESQTMVYRGKFKTKRHKSEKLRYFEHKKSCGGDVRTRDISELGVVLVARTTVGCKQKKVKSKRASAGNSGGGVYKYDAYGYAPGSPVAISFGDAAYGPMLLRGNELIGAGPDETVVARDVSSGTLRPYADQPDPSAIIASSDRKLAITANTFNGKNSPPVQTISVFPPAANAPALTIPVNAGETSFVAFCTDHFVQVSGPVHKESSWGSDRHAMGPLRLTLRDFTGAVVTEAAGPATGLFAGVTCNGRTATVATIGKDQGPLALIPYAL